MSTSTGDDPERQLSSALRAQAASNANPDIGTGAISADGAARASALSRPARLPVLRVLLFALVLGLIAGALGGVVTIL